MIYFIIFILLLCIYFLIISTLHFLIISTLHFLNLGTVTGLTRGVFTVDFSPDNEHVAIAGGDSSIRILKIGKDKN